MRPSLIHSYYYSNQAGVPSGITVDTTNYKVDSTLITVDNG